MSNKNKELNILVIENNSNYIDDLKGAFNELKEALKTKINFKFFPTDENVEDFTTNIVNKQANKEDFYTFIKNELDGKDIDGIVLDFLLDNAQEDAGKLSFSGGNDFINKIKEEKSIFKDIPIFSYTRMENSLHETDINFAPMVGRINCEINKANMEGIVKYYKLHIGDFFKIINDMQKFKEQKHEKFDIAIICAIEEEFKEIKKIFNMETFQDRRNNNYYYKCKLGKYKIIGHCMHDMGMVESAVHTSEVINLFSPDLIIMTGICAGIDSENQKLGDIVIPKYVWNWQAGKHNLKKEKNRWKEYFDNDMRQKECKLDIDNRISPDKKTILTDIWNGFKTEYQGSPLCNEFNFNTFKVYTDKMVSGSAVVASKAIINEVKLATRKISALDMEAYGVAYASERHHINWLIVKSICDFADTEKGDLYHTFSSFVSAKMAYILIENNKIY